jgi:transcriptional regulator with XRE-family HTH domain
VAHLQPDRLRDAMTATGRDVASLAMASGVRADFLADALRGRRRLDVAAMRALAGPLAVDWWALRCDHATGQPAAPHRMCSPRPILPTLAEPSAGC